MQSALNSHIELSNGQLEVLSCDQCTQYLGKELCTVSPHIHEVESRMRKAWAKIHQFKPELTDQGYPLGQRCRLFHPGSGDSKCTIWIMLVDSDKRNGIQDKIDTAEDVEIYVGQEVVPKQ